MDVKVRQATLEDRERIEHFLQTAYQERAQYKFPERWMWVFVDNPFWGGNKGLPIWLAEADGQIVGQTCAMIVPLKLADSVRPAAWGVDFIVLPEFRRGGMGRLLLQAQTEYHEIFMALSMSPISRHVLADMGFEEANPAIELYKTLRSSPDQVCAIVDNRFGTSSLLSRVCRIRVAGALLVTMLDSFTRVRDLVRLRARARAIAIKSVDRFGDEIDQLWTRLSSRFSMIVQRDAAYLNWKFADQPHMVYDKFVAKRNQVLRGYVITRTGVPPEDRVGVIADLFAAPDDDEAIRCLLAHAVRHLKRAGVRYVIAASSVPEYLVQYLEQGFTRTRDEIPMIRSKKVDHIPTDRWFLSMGDHDWDQYPLTTGPRSQGA